MKDRTLYSRAKDNKTEISIRLDVDLLEQVEHLTNDPSKVIESALRQWLKGEREREDEVSMIWNRTTPVPPKGEWND